MSNQKKGKGSWSQKGIVICSMAGHSGLIHIIPALRRQKDVKVVSQPGLHSEFWTSPNYLERPSLKDKMKLTNKSNLAGGKSCAC